MRSGGGFIEWGRASRHKIWEPGLSMLPYLVAAPGRGFEPRLTDPESAVLPLDDPGRSPTTSTNSASEEYNTTAIATLQPIAERYNGVRASLHQLS